MMKQKENTNFLSEIKTSYISKYLVGVEILDVGAGNGKYCSWLVNQKTFQKIIALDHQNIQDPTGFEFVCADLENKINFENESFSTIFAFDVIEHINNVDQLMNELYRVCKNNGILIGSVPHDDDKFLPAYNLTFYHRSDLTHKRYYTEQSLKNCLEKAGFSIKLICKEGGVSPHVIAEFFPKHLQFLVRKTVGLLRRIKLINSSVLSSDLFFVAYK